MQSCMQYSGKFSKQRYSQILPQLWKLILQKYWTCGLFMCSNRLFHMCGYMLLYKYFAAKDELPHPTGLLSFWLSSLAIVAASEEKLENTKVMDSEKEKTMKNCIYEWWICEVFSDCKNWISKGWTQHEIMTT